MFFRFHNTSAKWRSLTGRNVLAPRQKCVFRYFCMQNGTARLNIFCIVFPTLQPACFMHRSSLLCWSLAQYNPTITSRQRTFFTKPCSQFATEILSWFGFGPFPLFRFAGGGVRLRESYLNKELVRLMHNNKNIALLSLDWRLRDALANWIKYLCSDYCLVSKKTKPDKKYCSFFTSRTKTLFVHAFDSQMERVVDEPDRKSAAEYCLTSLFPTQ